MSTRATYTFEPSRHDVRSRAVCIYKHHDGYPQGAATWIYNAFVHRQRGLAEGFLRGNPESELTDSHDAHGDTDYRYTVQPDESHSCGWTVTALRRIRDDESWALAFRGSLIDFVAEHSNPDWVDDYSPLIAVESAHHRGGERWLTEREAKQELREKCRMLGFWSREKPAASANADSLRREIHALAEAVDPLCAIRAEGAL